MARVERRTEIEAMRVKEEMEGKDKLMAREIEKRNGS